MEIDPVKLAAVAMVRNECDIIELFVKINSRTFDHIFLFDHQSDDGTRDIIRDLETAGYPISLSILAEREYIQARILTEKIREIARKNNFDYIMSLDADEFLASDSSESSIKATIESAITKNETGLIPWKTYCPVNDEYYSCTAPLFENFRMRKAEPFQHYKTILGNNFAKNCVLAEGCHSAENKSISFGIRKITVRIIGKIPFSILKFFSKEPSDGKRGPKRKLFLRPRIIPLILQHVPVRSSGQIIRKAILGSHTLALKKTRIPFESCQWEEIASKIRKNDYRLASSELTSIALRYSAFINGHNGHSGHELMEMSDDGPRIGLKSDSLDDKDLALIEPLKSFDNYISGLVAQLTRPNRPGRVRGDKKQPQRQVASNVTAENATARLAMP